MQDLKIERLSLRLAGLSEGESRRLPRLIAEGLAGAAPGIAEQHDAMRVRISTHAGASAEELSKQIVAELVRQLERSV